jgi:hypothetical protein
MADPLDIGGGFEEKAFLVSEAALEHPQRWVDRGSFSLFHAMDYGLEEVREKMFVIIADICGRYDVDGIELDLLRAPIYFRANAEGNPDAGAENRDKMTAFLRRIRQMTEDVGCRRKRPLLIAIRVPDDVETAFALGLDTSLWLEESLLDILIAGASWRFRPWKEIVTLGHKYGVPVYANPTEGGMSPEAYRGRTLAAWASGVDGIYTFNETEPDSLAWNELGDPEKLLELDRMTPVENARIERHEMSHINRLPGVSRFLARAPRLPLSLPTGEEKSFEFTAAEDGARVAASTTPHVSLHVQFHNLEDGDEITVVLNGNPLEFEETLRDCPRPGWVIFQPDPSSLRWGDNLLALTVTGRDPEAGGPLALADMQLHVTAEPGEFRREVREIPEPSAQAGYIEKAAFLITESEILPPPQKMNAQRQWLLDELEFARPRSPVARTMLESFSDYPPDPVEKPLPGWKSLAVVFDANETGARCARELMNAFFAKVAPQFIDGELGLYAGELAGTATLAALVVRSRSPENLEHIARQFGRDAQVKGLLPFPVRFLRAEDDGHLIPRVFAIVFRGTLRDGFFTHAPGCWKENVRGVHGVQNGRGFTKG